VAQESKAPKTATKNKAFVVSPARFIPAVPGRQNPGKKKPRHMGSTAKFVEQLALPPETVEMVLMLPVRRLLSGCLSRFG
jgi:hypothetical protein